MACSSLCFFRAYDKSSPVVCILCLPCRAPVHAPRSPIQQRECFVMLRRTAPCPARPPHTARCDHAAPAAATPLTLAMSAGLLPPEAPTRPPTLRLNADVPLPPPPAPAQQDCSSAADSAVGAEKSQPAANAAGRGRVPPSVHRRCAHPVSICWMSPVCQPFCERRPTLWHQS